MWLDTWADSERELRPCGSLNHSLGHFFQVSFGQSFDLPSSESVLGASQDPATCACASLSQDGF